MVMSEPVAMPDGTPAPLTEPLVDTRPPETLDMDIRHAAWSAKEFVDSLSRNAQEGRVRGSRLNALLVDERKERTRLDKQVEGLTVLLDAARRERDQARQEYNGVRLSLQTCERQLREALSRPPWGDIPQDRIVVLRAVLDERIRQINDLGFTLEGDDRHGTMEWIAILIHEVNKYSLLWLDAQNPQLPDFRSKMIQVAALAVAAAEWVDRRDKRVANWVGESASPGK